MGKVFLLRGRKAPYWVIDLSDTMDQLKEDIKYTMNYYLNTVNHQKV